MQSGPIRSLGMILMLGLLIAFYCSGISIFPARFASAPFYEFLFLSAGILMVVGNILYFAWQILLAAQYKPYATPKDAELPTMAVIMPAFNEGRQVYQALESVLKSDYPADKLEILAIDDGSRDDTWDWIRKACNAANGRIQAFRLSRNGGKRNALYHGFSNTKAAVVVTLDSDSVVTPETLRNMAGPFVADPTIGGVAGNIRVLNKQGGMIPKMLDVSFVFGFEFLRSAQSVVRSVLCTPGALSAYRRSAIMPHMNEWVYEKFMGKPANIGEDRAITNILIREGYGVVFQQSATVYTEMPLKYAGLCKMLIRWGRSNVRENISMAKFAFKTIDFSNDDLIGMQLNLIVQTFWMVAPLVFCWYTVYCLVSDAFLFIVGASAAIVFWSTLPAFVYARRYSKQESLWSYVYGFFSFMTLFWVSPYCLFTVGQSGWLTRQTPHEPAKKPKSEFPMEADTHLSMVRH